MHLDRPRMLQTGGPSTVPWNTLSVSGSALELRPPSTTEPAREESHSVSVQSSQSELSRQPLASHSIKRALDVRAECTNCEAFFQ